MSDKKDLDEGRGKGRDDTPNEVEIVDVKEFAETLGDIIMFAKDNFW